ncbi:MAG: GNAT family N-acetyltransferase [Bacteroidetes bacterium]|nr:GNAT family N-acetyltransferase [Bacteroidota bacterium]
MTDQIVIRQLNEDEVPPYELLLDADPSREMVDGYLGASEAYVAVYKNETVGIYVLHPVNASVAEIKNIAVAGRYQGRGIGKLLLNDAERRARAYGFKVVQIGTGNSSTGPLALYQKRGFEIKDIKRNFFIDNYAEPLFEDGIRVKHMIVLEKEL